MKRLDAAPDVLDVMQVLWALAHALEARSKRMHRDLGNHGPPEAPPPRRRAVARVRAG